MRRSHGFTLVELLVVIGIIALLISILLPALNKARSSAQNIKCMSNLRSIGQGLHIYASEHDGRLPPMMISFKPDYLRTKGSNDYRFIDPTAPVDGDVRPVLRGYVDYQGLQCPLPEHMNLDYTDTNPGADRIETSYVFYADWKFDPAPAPALDNKRFSEINGYFNYHRADGTVYQFDVLAGDLDTDASELFGGNYWETSHPTANSGPESYSDSNITLSRFVHSGNQPRAKMTRNLLFNDGSVISYPNVTYNYGGDETWVRVPLASFTGNLWTYLPKKGLR